MPKIINKLKILSTIIGQLWQLENKDPKLHKHRIQQMTALNLMIKN